MTHYNKIMSEESKYINPNFSQSICLFCNQRGEKWTLSSHINESKDTFSGGDARLMAHKEDTKEESIKSAYAEKKLKSKDLIKEARKLMKSSDK